MSYLRRSLAGPSAFVVILAACVGPTGETTTIPATTTPPSTTSSSEVVVTTTTIPEPACPDVFCLVYHLRPEATWSDGVPISSGDLAFTQELMADRDGHDLVTGWDVIDDSTIRFHLSEAYGAWPTLFEVVLPRHALEDMPLETTPLDRIPVTGPFAVASQIEGESITLERVARFWSEVDPVSGAPAGDVRRIEMVQVEGARDRIGGLDRSEIHFVELRPLPWMVEELGESETVVFEVGPGPFWEHITFNHADPLLSQLWMRQAIAQAIDRAAIVEELVGSIDDQAETLESSIWMQGSPHYSDNFPTAHDPASSVRLLEDRGCTEGDDGVYECGGTPLSFVWASTVGDETRRTQFEMVRDDLAVVGIELVESLTTPSELFSGDVLFGGPDVWQMINFSWRGDTDPHRAEETYHCRGDAPSGFGALNVARYCDEQVDGLIREAAATVDQTERAALYTEADSLYLTDVAIVPLYQKPRLIAWNTELAGPLLNGSTTTSLWNIAAWMGLETLVIALEDPPELLTVSYVLDEPGTAALDGVLYGAYEIDGELRPRPVLVERVEPIMGVDSR